MATLTLQAYNATLVERTDFTPELAAFRIRPSQGPVPDYRPGQYATLGLFPAEAPPEGKKPKLVRRAYSIASSPNRRDEIEFYIVRVEGGKLTPRLWDLQPGDELFMDPRCRGTFTIDELPPRQDLVMVCTGTGLAPYLSMLETFRGSDRWNRVALVHGARLAADLGYRATLESFAAADPTLTYLPMVTREPEGSGWTGLRGRVHGILEPGPFEAATGWPLDPARTHVLLCGNPAMIDECQANLGRLGFVTRCRETPDGNIHFERYW